MFQLAEGDFYPGKPKGKSFFDLTEDNSDMIDITTKQVFPMICINDGYISEDTFPRVQAEICGAFSQILPERSHFSGSKCFGNCFGCFQTKNGVIRMDDSAEEVLAAYNEPMDGQVDQTQ